MSLLPCPCCGYLTIGERACYEICEVCFWEDDGQGDEDADSVWGGPNGEFSLTQARLNFRQFGAYDRAKRSLTRNPKPEEIPR
ncbi:MAG: CPCC family cysteine-rich protein [Pseudomonadota bacterium]